MSIFSSILQKLGFGAAGGPVEALVTLRARGLVDHIGVAGGPVALMRRYLETGLFDVVLTHNRYTLVDRSAEELFGFARQHGIGVVNAAPYGGGMLAKGPDVQSNYGYGERPGSLAEAVRSMAELCARHGVPLPAAALQFSLRSPLIDSTVVGVSSPERVAQTLEYAGWEIPDALWAELEELVPASQGWLG